MNFFNQPLIALLAILLATSLHTLPAEASLGYAKGEVCFFDECLDGSLGIQDHGEAEGFGFLRQSPAVRPSGRRFSRRPPFLLVKLTQACNTQAGSCPISNVLPQGPLLIWNTRCENFPGIAKLPAGI